MVHPADIQDRDGGVLVLSTMLGMFPFLLKVFADGGYQGPQFRSALARVLPQLSVEIVKRSDRAKGSRCSLNAGSSNAPWHGLIAAAASPRTSRI